MSFFVPNDKVGRSYSVGQCPSVRSEDCGLYPKYVSVELTSNLACVLIEWVFRNYLIFGSVAKYLAPWWAKFFRWVEYIKQSSYRQADICHCHRSWWRHQMETFSALLAICVGNSPVPLKSPHNGQWRGASMFSSICGWINRWVNNREAGDLRRYRAHYDVVVMVWNSRCTLKNANA